jgi:hypothetical protein
LISLEYEIEKIVRREIMKSNFFILRAVKLNSNDEYKYRIILNSEVFF